MKDAEKLLRTIREQNIKPLPKAYFSVRNLLIWMAFGTAVLLGAPAFAVILFAIQQTDFSVLNHLSHSRLEFFLGVLPFVWILMLVAFLSIAIYSIQYAPKSYKLSAARWVAYSTALSILLGTLFFIGGGAQRLENSFEVHISLYESIQEKKIKMWSNPDAGFLSGEILQTTTEQIILKDFSGKQWTVLYANAFIAPILNLEKGEQLRLTGKVTDNGFFKADAIRPWGGGAGNFGRGTQHPPGQRGR